MDTLRKSLSRRDFIRQNAVLGAGSMLALGAVPNLFASPKASFPAMLGGDPIHKGGWSEWPIWKPETDEERVLEVLRSGVWSRAGIVSEFEAKWAETVGAMRCLTFVTGTNALIASLLQLDIGAGDEVLVPPYAFIAAVAAVVAAGAMPVFVDVDRETLQIAPSTVE